MSDTYSALLPYLVGALFVMLGLSLSIVFRLVRVAKESKKR